jgi:peptide/nickel transport system substrate-binding protein
MKVRTSTTRILACLLVGLCMSLVQPAIAKEFSEKDKVPGFNFWITSQTYDPVRYEIGLMVAKKWKNLGFDIEITALEWATMSSKGMKGHEHDVFMIQWGGKPERVDPMHWLYTLHHSNEARSGGYNVAGYNNPAYDKIVEGFVKSVNLEERQRNAFKAQEILSHDVPQPPIIHRIITHAYNSRDFSNPTFAMGEGLNSFWNWLSITPKGERKSARFGYVTDIKLLNPLSTKTGADIYMLRMIYDSLIRMDANGKPVPWAAKSYKYTSDTKIKVVLREGMTFHDGKPVTVDDVKYTFDLIMGVKSPYYASKIKKLKGVAITGKNELTFTLSEPYAPFISNGFGTVCILPKHIWQKKYEAVGKDGILKWDNSDPVGSGPFQFSYWRPNEEMKLTRFGNHFHPPKIEEFIRIPYAKAYGVVQGLQAGEIDAAGWSLLPLEKQSLSAIPHLTIGTIDDQGYYMLHYNMRKKPFNDVRIRRALTYAIPKKQIVELIFSGQAVPAYSTVAAVNKFWHNPDVEKIGDNFQKSKEILNDAGFRWDSKGKIYYPKNYQLKTIMK